MASRLTSRRGGSEINLHRYLQYAVARDEAGLRVEFGGGAPQRPDGGRIDSVAQVPQCRRRALLIGLVIGQAAGDVEGQAGVEIVELRLVEHVERLQSQLNVARTVSAQAYIFKQRQVGHVDARTPYDRTRLRARVDVRNGDLREVESRFPADRRLRIAGQDRARAFRPRAADAL